jgi:WD40 repeat protein
MNDSASARMASASPRSLFVLHSTDEDDAEFVYSHLLPALRLPEERVKISSAGALGQLITEALTENVLGTSVTVAVLSPSFLAQGWASFGNALATYHAVHGGQLIPLLWKPCQVPMISRIFTSLDMSQPSLWQGAIEKLRLLLEQPEPAPRVLPCPYPGLLPYTEEAADSFAGRAHEVEELATLIAGGLRELYVLGRSGVGKTSLLRAGVAARLSSAGNPTNREPFEVRFISPASAVAPQLATVKGAIAATARRVLVVIDPLDALFRETNEATRQTFARGIEELHEEPRCHLAFALRSDFSAELLRSELGPRARSAYHYTVQPLRLAALRQAIAMPAMNLGVALAPTLVEWLRSDAEGQPGALPLLQETLVDLWTRRKYDYVSVESYAELGRGAASGLASIAVTRATIALHGLSAEQQALAKRTMLRLVKLGSGAPTKRLRSISELRGGETAVSLEEVLSTLIEERVIVADANARDMEATFELAHDSLITSWPPLRNWIGEHGEHEQRRSALDERARASARAAGGAPGSGLLDEAELRELDLWFTPEVRQALGTGEALEPFIAASRAAVQTRADERAARETAQRELLASYHVERGRSHLRGGRGAKALPYLVAARALGDDSFALTSLVHWARRSLPRRTGLCAARAMAWSPDGSRIALAEDAGVRMWSPHTGQWSALHGSPAAATHLAWSRPGGTLLAIGSERTVELWNPHLATRARPPLEQLTHGAPLHMLRWTHDGARLARMRAGLPSRLWDLSSGDIEPLLLDEELRISTARWSPDGKWLAVIDASKLSVQHALTGETLSTRDVGACISAISWSPCGQRLAVACVDRTARVWDARTLKTACSPLLEHAETILAIEWSHDGAVLATLCGHAVFMWAELDEAPPLVRKTSAIARQPAPVPESLSPDGCRLARATEKSVCVHAALTGEVLSPPMEHKERIVALAWSPESQRLATACDRLVRIWDPTAGAVLSHDLLYAGELTSLRWNEDGTALRVSTVEEGELRPWPTRWDPGTLDDWRAAARGSLHYAEHRELIEG